MVTPRKPQRGHRRGGGDRRGGGERPPPPPRLSANSPPTPELEKWRGAVVKVTSASQLAVCVAVLDRCIAWEKSATKVVSNGHRQ